MFPPRQAEIRWALIGPVLFFSLLILLVNGYAPPPRPGIAPVSALQPLTAPERPLPPGAATPTAVPLTGDLLQMGLLRIAIHKGALRPEEQPSVAGELQRAMDYVVARFGSAPAGPMEVLIGLEPACGLHGIAYTDIRNVQVFTCAGFPAARAVSVMAHEFVHQLCQDRYGERHVSADLVLSEGVATWGAGAYWLGDAPTFRAFVRPWFANGEELPLGISYVGRTISDMNKLYYQWASFVEFLIETYGREAFDRLYLTGQNAPGSADYPGVYGKTFEILEAEWRAWVLGG
ncbi:MAG: hypothetical protein ACUVS4_07045 [Chloroflexaceae bacterium]